ncbi:hypothetical protein [Thiomicrorhabdus xiamenensis]|uniref:Uncharacterized protein n=1 Tax=Thiomicrorhabdus xiamenensis TaxID=2739063 RepID=A0A7D4NQP5_9GAMM|nr:hypothetical protein [Thiomicrorhabdus xiamenensis]QKI88890.1 hypothetical protein HQN79_04565 [Thiomicrorhabdus xiamenensis]
MIQSLKQIDPEIRKWVARILILFGIAIAYSPYWIDSILEKEILESMSGPMMSVGWWILGLGLVLYFFNMWLEIKSENKNTD